MEKKAESKQKKTTSPSKRHAYSDSDDESGSQSSSPRSRQKARKGLDMPAWTQKGGKKALAVINVDDDDDDETGNEDADDSLSINRTPVPKKKKVPNRSPSITPPPPVPVQQLMNARNLVRQAFHARSSSPVIDVDEVDELNESVELAPELAAIAAAKQHSGPVTANNATGESSAAPQVTLTIKWMPHPKDDEGEIQIFQINMRQDEPFSNLFSDLADEAGVLEDKLVLTFNGKRVFPASTPHSLGVWSAAEFEAYNLHVYEFIQAQKRERALSPNAFEPDVPSFASVGNDLEEPGAADSGLESDGGSQDTFKLTLRAGASQSVTVTVRQSTKCSSIVASFLKKTGKPTSASKKARISVDGESLNPNDPIEVAGLEDGDVADIVGL